MNNCTQTIVRKRGERMKRTTVTPEWMGEVRKRTKVNNRTSRDLAAACGWSESVVRKYINSLYYNDNPHADIEIALKMR